MLNMTLCVGVSEDVGETDEEGVGDDGATNVYEMAIIGSPESPPVLAIGTPPVKLTVTVEF
jgi:hypothetical protein